MVASDGARLAALVQLLAQGVLTVPVAVGLPLDQGAEALTRARHGAHGAAIVLRPQDAQPKVNA